MQGGEGFFLSDLVRLTPHKLVKGANRQVARGIFLLLWGSLENFWSKKENLAGEIKWICDQWEMAHIRIVPIKWKKIISSWQQLLLDILGNTRTFTRAVASSNLLRCFGIMPFKCNLYTKIFDPRSIEKLTVKKKKAWSLLVTRSPTIYQLIQTLHDELQHVAKANCVKTCHRWKFLSEDIIQI